MAAGLTTADAAALATAALTWSAGAVALGLVARRAPAGPARHWLLLVLGALALLALGDLVRHLHWNAVARWTGPVADAALLVLGPATWSYAGALADPGLSVRRRWRHLLPAVAFLVLLLAVAAGQPPKEDRAVWRSLAELMVLAPVAVHLCAYGLGLATFVARLRTALRRRDVRRDVVMRRPPLRWVQILFGLYGVLVVATIATWPWPLAWSNVLTNVVVAAAIAWAGSNGLRQGPIAVTAAELAADPDDAQT